MKNKVLIIIISFLSIGIGCEDFKVINDNPNTSTNIDPNMLLSYTQIMTYGDKELVHTYHNTLSSFMQYFMGEWGPTRYGGTYSLDENQANQVWGRMYNELLKNIIDMELNTRNKDEYKNLNAVARIYKVYLFSILTDLFGDIPYFEAGKGYYDLNLTPNYDTQESIYLDFFKELKEAVNTLSTPNESLPITGDIIYKGNIEQWRRFGNSLILRYAMRISNVKPDIAEEEVQKVIQNELFQTAADDAVIPYMEIYDQDYGEYRRNALSALLINESSTPESFICSTFWNFMKENNDPRLFVICRGYYGEGSFLGQTLATRPDITKDLFDLDPDGLSWFQPSKPGFYWWDNWPNGFWSSELNAWIDKWTRPQPNTVLLKPDIPGILMTYAELNYLLSEAKARWENLNTEKTSQQYFTEGVKATMKLLSERFKTIEITESDVNNYISRIGFPDNLDGRLKLIGEQLWMLHFNNPVESYSSYRRIGYPQLKSARDYGAITMDAQHIPRRLLYPITEKSYNPKGYSAALERVGGNLNWTIPVWWDKN